MPPIKAFTVTRRNLPHWQQPGSTYFLTWRALTLMLEPDDRIITLNAILFWDARRWDVYAAVVMPDHVHVLVRPRPISPSSPEVFHSLSAILHSVKGFTSHRINDRLNRSGCVWQDETYDRIMRDEEEFIEKWHYIRTNPVKAGLVATPEEYPWHYEAVYPMSGIR